MCGEKIRLHINNQILFQKKLIKIFYFLNLIISMKNIKVYSFLAIAFMLVTTLSSCKKKAKPGDYVYCNLYVYCDDKQLFSSLEMGEMARIPVTDPAKKDSMAALGIVGPVNEKLLTMGKGDSASVEQSLDTMQNKPMACPGAKKLIYRIKVIDIVDNKKYLADIEEERKKRASESDEMRKNGEAINEKLTQMVTKDSATWQGRRRAVEDSVKLLATQYKSGAFNSQLKTSPAGVKYLVLKEGSGNAAKVGDALAMNYYGALTSTAQRFDDSYERGKPFAFVAHQGEVIGGWDDMSLLLKSGATVVMFIPPQLAYGSRTMPGIPANSELMFYVECLQIFPFMTKTRPFKVEPVSLSSEPEPVQPPSQKGK